MKDRMSHHLEYVVGAEKSLRELIGEEEVMPLLKGVVEAGASRAELTDGGDRMLWWFGVPPGDQSLTVTLPVLLEGETAGKVTLRGRASEEKIIRILSGMLAATITAMLRANLKRILTTETHTKVVNQSYEELLETNKRLRTSEARYKDLASSLEEKVRERTEELRAAHSRMLQQEKMASVGQLAAGVAHEINNPLSFLASNINTLGKYVARFREMLLFYRSASGGDDTLSQFRKEAGQKWESLRIDRIMADVGELIAQSLEGAERVGKIVSDLKGFSHIDDGEEMPVDINSEIDKTLRVASYEMPEGAEIARDFEPLPAFTCNPALLCQVFLNLILNAAQSRRGPLRLSISTEEHNGEIAVTFSDNGSGIPEEIRSRIFEPFFTTKEVGAGKGLGLTVAYEIVTAYHGTITVESEQGKGACFTIRLPSKKEK